MSAKHARSPLSLSPTNFVGALRTVAAGRTA